MNEPLATAAASRAGASRLAATRDRLSAHPKYKRWLLWVVLTGVFAARLPGTILAISIKTIAVDLHSNPGTISWVTTAPMLAAAVGVPVLGRLGDLRGHRRLYLYGLFAAGAFSLLTAAAWNAISLILFLTISQVGSAAMVPSTFAMLFRSFPEGERVRTTSLAQGTMAASAMAGVVIGGPLVDLIGWRSIFIIQAVLCAVVLIPAAILLRPDEPPTKKIPVDYWGAFALAAATFALTYGINRLGVWGLTPISVGSLIAAAIGTYAFVRIERRAEAPLLPIQLLSSRNTWFVVGTSFLIGVSWMGTLLLSPLYLQSVLGLSVGITALIVAPRAGTGMLVAPLTGRLGVRYGERRLVIGCSIIIAATMVMLAVGAQLRSIAVIAIAIAVSGTCMASAQAGLIAAAGHSVSEPDFGVAVSLQQTSNQIGSVLGLGLFAAIAANATTPGPFILVFLLSGAMAALGSAAALGLPRKRARSRTSVPARVVDGKVDGKVEPALDPT